MKRFTQKLQKKVKMISIPTIEDWDLLESRREKADSQKLESCPCCGKAIKNPKLFITSAFGGEAYIPDEETKVEEMMDTWMMAIGPECAKKFPKEYITKQ